jgi:hypothetical protein
MSSNNPARGKERLKIDFMVVAESKRQRESVTAFRHQRSRRFNKNYKDPALIPRQSRERVMARQSLALAFRLTY